MEGQVYQIFQASGHGGISLVTVVTASCILHNISEIQNNKCLSSWHANDIGIEEQAEEEPGLIVLTCSPWLNYEGRR